MSTKFRANKIKAWVFLFLLCLFNANIIADPLLLTPAEMQKLQRYFPAQDDDTKIAQDAKMVTDDMANLVWKGDPISIALPLNKEKRIVFPSAVVADLKSALSTDQLRLINDNQSLYLTALKPFPASRMYVTLQSTHEVLLIDIMTNDKADNSTTTIKIISSKPSQVVSNNFDNTSADMITNSSNVPTDNDTSVTLLRFAWQELYAPERLLNNPLSIVRVPLRSDFIVANLIYGDKVYAHPIASWFYQGTYLTALELRNKYPHPTKIDLNKDLCGDWQAATLYPRMDLKSLGQKSGDSTVLFLVSKKPFSDAMEVCYVHA